MELIRATLGDAARIAPFHLECAQVTYAEWVLPEYLAELGRQDRVATWRERLSRPYDGTLLAVLDGAVIGLATVGPLDVPSLPPLELRSLYVSPAHQRTGIGRRLVDTALDGRAAALWVLEADPRSRAFYGRTGWQPTGERQFDAAAGVWDMRMRRG